MTAALFCALVSVAAAVQSDGSPQRVRSSRQGAADTVLRHGYVYTVDKHGSVAQALAIDHGKIVYVGTDRGVRRFIGGHTKVVDLHGHMVMPSLEDAHNHAMAAGAELLKCNLEYAPLTVAQFKARIQACLDETKDEEPDGWLQVVGWYRQAMQPPGTEVSKTDLDALNTQRPIVMRSTDGHTVLANSRAMQIAGVTAATPDPPSGQIIRGPDGEPTGIFEDSAGDLVSSKVPPPTAADLREDAAASLQAMREQGITAFMLQIAGVPDMHAYRYLAGRGALSARAFMAPELTTKQMQHPKQAVRFLRKLRARFDSGPLRARPAVSLHNVGELFQDGVLQWPAQTASVFKPYLVNKGTAKNPQWVPGPSRGPSPYTKTNTLRRLVMALVKARFEPEIHAIGDRAVRHVLNVYAYVRHHLNRPNVRLEIAHAELVDPQDYARFRKLDVVPDMGFQWAKPGYDSIDATKAFLGPARFNRMEPEGYLYRDGVRIAQGSDWPVDPLDQFFSMEVLVTREGELGGKYAGPLGKVPGVPIKGAIRAFTINTAYALHAQREIGSLQTGKLADLIVINQNLLKIPARRISDTKVLTTMVGGRVVYQAP